MKQKALKKHLIDQLFDWLIDFNIISTYCPIKYKQIYLTHR